MVSAVKKSSASEAKTGKSPVERTTAKMNVAAAAKEPTKMQLAKEKADRTWKMGNTLAKALIRRHSKRWQCVDFLGEGGASRQALSTFWPSKSLARRPVLPDSRNLISLRSC